jgi:ketosteroid isomerase-like protein
MSEQDVEVVRGGYESFLANGTLDLSIATPDFAWDMSHFAGWPEQQVYDGAEGTLRFLTDWTAAWDDWRLEVHDVLDAGDRVVVLLSQHGRSKSTGLPVDMEFAQVWYMRDGLQRRMEMYSDPEQALRDAGLA